MTGRSHAAHRTIRMRCAGAVIALVCATVVGAGRPMTLAAAPGQSRSAATNVARDADTATERELELRAIRNVLRRYSTAFSTLNARAAAAVWPTVDVKALARAFDSLDGQNVSLHDCRIDTTGVRAEAACSGTARYVPKVGRRERRPEPHRWRFTLHKANDGWLIDHVEARAEWQVP
jgi:hypothetical protein